jgi:hypothetical protein
MSDKRKKADLDSSGEIEKAGNQKGRKIQKEAGRIHQHEVVYTRRG